MNLMILSGVFFMKASEVLKKIRDLKAKNELLAAKGKEDPELNYKINAYNLLKSALSERQQEVLKLYYEKDYNHYRTAEAVGFSSSTISRDLKKIKDKYQELLEI